MNDKTVFIFANHRIGHSMDLEIEVTTRVDPVTGNYALRQVPKFLEPGRVHAVTPELKAELIAKNASITGGQPAMREPTDVEMVLYRQANPLAAVVQ